MRQTPIILIVAVLLTVPSFAAAWGAKGDNEPSTALDRTGGYMHTTPNTAAVNKVYFNGWLGQQPCWATCTEDQVNSFNPNVATLNSGIMAAPSVAYAMLGIWRDCNNDGFIGFGDQGLLEYPAVLPGVSTTTCPVKPIPAIWPRNSLPPHNDGKLIREFLPIGWDSKPGNTPCNMGAIAFSCQDINPFDVNDTGSRVWSDFNRPGEAAGSLCYVSAHPRGTWQSVGGIVANSDCLANGRIYGAITAAGLASTYDANKGYDCEDSSVIGTYNTGCNPWGTSDNDAYVDAFDCDSKAFEGKTLDVMPRPRDPTNESRPLLPGGVTDDANDDGADDAPGRMIGTWLPNVSQPRGGAPPTNREGSTAGTINETEGDIDDCRENDQGNSTARNVPYALFEADIIDTHGVRISHDTTFHYNENIRPAAPHGVATGQVLGKQVSSDLGLGLHRDDDLWEGEGVMLASRNPYVSRDQLAPAPVTYVTYYATVSATAISTYGLVLPPSTGVYASEACPGGIGSGAPNGPTLWACDPDAWWPGYEPCGTAGADGCTQTSDGPIPRYVRPGQTYQLRDVDCYDGAVKAMRDQGLTYHGLAANGSRCQL